MKNVPDKRSQDRQLNYTNGGLNIKSVLSRTLAENKS